jgi:hypothetical protein
MFSGYFHFFITCGSTQFFCDIKIVPILVTRLKIIRHPVVLTRLSTSVPHLPPMIVTLYRVGTVTAGNVGYLKCGEHLYSREEVFMYAPCVNSTKAIFYYSN